MKTAGILPDAAPLRTDGSEAAALTANVALLGAGGYAGQEFARLALRHPGIRLAALLTREPDGASARTLLPGLDPAAENLPPVLSVHALGDLLRSGACDTIVTSLPHGAWSPLENALEAPLRSVRIVDLSQDHRDGSGGYVYGLPEAFRSDVAAASRVANPGCYPTAAALATLPAAELGWIEGPVTVVALSGVSGAGRAPALRTSFVELDGGASFYKVGTVHPHVREMERTLARLSGAVLPVGFVPQLVPMSRGILLTATARLARPVAPDEAREAWASRYAGEPFVRLLPAGEWPETRTVRGSNRCDVQVTTLHDGAELVACAAIDNLVKGAAGQAIQNLNLMLGRPETEGLPLHGSPW